MPGFIRSHCTLLLALAGAMTVAASASSRSSANYQITVESLAAGGGAMGGGPYAMTSSMGEIGAVEQSADSGGRTVAIHAGFPGQLPSFVVGRWIFYNQCAWDGNNAGANSSDDGAIAPDKTALLPGQNATFANYTSYSRGINGIMIDVSELNAVPSGSDLLFKKGNDNTPGSWASSAAPSIIDVRWGAGTNGSDRVTLIWPNAAIAKTWLELRIMADAATGLSQDDVFYFGNAIGETGDNANAAIVNAIDGSRVRVNQRNSENLAPIDFRFDINRDRVVNALDSAAIRVNNTSSETALALIQLAGSLHGLTASSTPSTLGDNVGLYLEIGRTGPDELTMAIEALQNGHYVLEYSSELVGQEWKAISAATANEEGQWSIRIDFRSKAVFFRVRRK